MSEGTIICLRKGKVMLMKHTIRICVSREPPDGGIVGCRHVTMRERLMRFLLGNQRRLMVIVLGDSVTEMSIIEEGCDKGE